MLLTPRVYVYNLGLTKQNSSTRNGLNSLLLLLIAELRNRISDLVLGGSHMHIEEKDHLDVRIQEAKGFEV